jgi:regulator of replication initiation timing
MSDPVPMTDNDRYEQACNQAIAMCDGNLRSTIKALIMANEYLEIELEQLQARVSNDHAPDRSRTHGSAA